MGSPFFQERGSVEGLCWYSPACMLSLCARSSRATASGVCGIRRVSHTAFGCRVRELAILRSTFFVLIFDFNFALFSIVVSSATVCLSLHCARIESLVPNSFALEIVQTLETPSA